MDEERLIIEVEKYRELYDPQCSVYEDNVKKDIAWRAIANVLQVSSDACKTKWKTLRDSFVRKIKAPQSSGSGASNQKELKYRDIMSFLLPYLQPRNSRSNVDGGEGNATEEGNATANPVPKLEDVVEQPADTVLTSTIQETPVRSTPAVQVGAKRKRQSLNETDKELVDFIKAPIQVQHLQQANPPPEKDWVDLFLLSLGTKFRRLNNRNQTRAQLQFLTVLDNLESAQENQTTFRPLQSYPTCQY